MATELTDEEREALETILIALAVAEVKDENPKITPESLEAAVLELFEKEGIKVVE